MSRIFAAVLAAALCSTQVAAQDAPPATVSLTLDEALAAAHQASPALEGPVGSKLRFWPG